MKLILLILYIIFSLVGIQFLIGNVISIFWFIYFVKSIVYRRNISKSCLQQNETSPQSLSYFNNKTFLVRDAFLLAMLLVEWFGLISTSLLIVDSHLIYVRDCLYRTNNGSYLLSIHASSNIPCYLNDVELQILNSEVNSSIFQFAYSCLSLCTVLVISLCRYLTARYARLSWIKSNTIPYFIFLSVLILVILNLLKFFCHLLFLSECILWIFEVILLGLMFRESKKLLMVMNWTNIDLSIAQNQPNLLYRSKCMKKRFKKFVILLWIGAFFFVFLHFLHISIFGADLILNFIHDHPENRSFCQIHSVQYIPQPIRMTVTVLSLISLTISNAMISLPFYLTSLYIMCVIIWRLVKGKSGLRTHFYYKNLKTPLIKC